MNLTDFHAYVFHD